MIIVHEQKPSIYLQVSYIGQHLYKSGFYCTSTGKNLSFFVFSKKSKVCTIYNYFGIDSTACTYVFDHLKMYDF